MLSQYGEPSGHLVKCILYYQNIKDIGKFGCFEIKFENDNEKHSHLSETPVKIP